MKKCVLYCKIRNLFKETGVDDLKMGKYAGTTCEPQLAATHTEWRTPQGGSPAHM